MLKGARWVALFAWAGLGLALLAALWAFLPPRAGSFARVAAGRLLLISMLFGAAEVVLHWLGCPAIPVVGWKTRVHQGQINQMNFRARHIAYGLEDFVVVLLGDSQVEAVALALGLPNRPSGGRDAWWERSRLPAADPPLSLGELGSSRLAGMPLFKAPVKENLLSGKNRLVPLITISGPRQEYGVSLTRAPMRNMAEDCGRHGAFMTVFQEDRSQGVQEQYGQGRPEFLAEHRGKRFLAGKARRLGPIGRVNRGFANFSAPITVRDWKISREDTHLNLAANRQAPGDLADLPAAGGALGKGAGARARP